MPLLSGTIMEAHWKQQATLNPESQVLKGWCSNPPGPVRGRRERTVLLLGWVLQEEGHTVRGVSCEPHGVEGDVKKEMETLKAMQEIRQRLSQVSMETGCLQHMADI